MEQHVQQDAHMERLRKAQHSLGRTDSLVPEPKVSLLPEPKSHSISSHYKKPSELCQKVTAKSGSWCGATCSNTDNGTAVRVMLDHPGTLPSSKANRWRWSPTVIKHPGTLQLSTTHGKSWHKTKSVATCSTYVT